MMTRPSFALVALLVLASPPALRAESPVPESPISEASFKDEAGDTASCDCDCDCEEDCCGRYGYVSAIAGVSFMNGQSGGNNSVGGFANGGSADDDLFLAGAAIGVAIPREYGTLRLEFEGRVRNEFHGVTDSFQPPVPTFFYDVAVTDGWSTLFNAWYDVKVRDRVAVYGGGGVGVGGYNMSVNDTVVSGRGTTADFTWQLGAGVIYEVNDRVELDFGYRYCNFGNGNIQLVDISNGNPGGNYQMALTSSDLLLQLRINEPLSFFRR